MAGISATIHRNDIVGIMKLEKAMRKLFIIGSKGPYSLGGYETFVRCLAPELGKLDFDVYVTSESCVKDEEKCSLPFNVVHMFKNPKSISPLVRILYDLYAAYLTIKLRADIVYMCGYNAAWVLFLPLLFGKKVFINSDGIEWARPSWGNNLIKRYYLIANEYLMKCLPMEVISDSRAIVAFLENRLSLHSWFIPYGGNSFEFSPTEQDKLLLAKYQLAEKQYYFISVRIVEDNLIDRLIEVFRNIDVKLVIIGAIPDTSYGSFIQSILHENIIVLDMTSMNPEYNIIRYYAKANIHSHQFGGTSPNLLEVMALKLPVIAYDTVYSREVLGKNALYYNSPETLQARIVEFENLPLETPGHWVKENIKKIKRTYNWQQVARECAKVFSVRAG